MNQKELKELIDFLVERDIAEFELERGDVKVRVKRGAQIQVTHAEPIVGVPVSAPSVAQTVATPAAPPPAAAPPAAAFYEAPAPGAPPFVKPGDSVEAGQVLCIIEAMKLMNEIESDVAGEVVKRLVANNQPVEYGQPLFAIRPRA
jgi:acetyl-CoA carboxylase biotin carboxyl carrier protein